MKKKTAVALLCAVIVIAAAALICTNFIGKKPFASLKAEDIASASVQLLPPNRTAPVTDLDALAAALNDAVIYRKDSSYTEYSGQAVTFTLIMADGSQEEITAYSPFLIVNGTGYRAKYGPCEQLSRYANQLRNAG